MSLFGRSRAAALRSGSSGNLYFFEEGMTRLVVDCGVNGRSFASSLHEIGVPEDEIPGLDGILVTHEHSDHISGIGVLLRRYRLPLYISARTLKAALPSLGKFDPNLIRLIYPGERFELGDFSIEAVPISHDAAEPLAFVLDNGRWKAGVCTDLGVFTPEVEEKFRGSRLIFLEANYEPGLLDAGPYPYYLKQRIRGERGHLSNQDCAHAALRLLESGTEELILSHLSRENNYPEMAELIVSSVLHEGGAVRDRDYRLSVARRFSVTPPVEFEGALRVRAGGEAVCD